jgi:hypothetical protein
MAISGSTSAAAGWTLGTEEDVSSDEDATNEDGGLFGAPDDGKAITNPIGGRMGINSAMRIPAAPTQSTTTHFHLGLRGLGLTSTATMRRPSTS